MDCKRAAPSGVARPLQYVRSGLRADLADERACVHCCCCERDTGSERATWRAACLSTVRRLAFWRVLPEPVDLTDAQAAGRAGKVAVAMTSSASGKNLAKWSGSRDSRAATRTWSVSL